MFISTCPPVAVAVNAVDVVGDQVQDGPDITAAEGLVHLPGRLDVLLGGHVLAPSSPGPGSGPERGRGRRVADELLDSAHAPALHGHEQDLRPSIARPSGRLALS